MTIWILALVLMAASAAAGYRQGAIRVGFSLVGILIAALLAGPLAKLVIPALRAFGVSNPIYLWIFAPVTIFILVLVVFKVSGLAVHQKVDVHYKYKAGDLRLSLFERINARLGLCLGLVNGLIYLILVSFGIQVLSYWTVQISSPSDNPRIIRILNTMGEDLNRTGMANVAGAFSSMKKSFYDSADVAGLVFHNPLLEARITRYPGFIALGMRQEFQTLGADAEFSRLRLAQRPIKELMAHPTLSAIVNNPTVMRETWEIVQPDLHDFSNFLYTAKSEKYDEPIIGKWSFSAGGTALALRKDKPRTAVSELQKLRRMLAERFSKIAIVAAPTGQLAIKNVPRSLLPAPGQTSVELESHEGKWSGAAGAYQLEAGSGEAKSAKVDAHRLTTTWLGFTVVFDKED